MDNVVVVYMCYEKYFCQARLGSWERLGSQEFPGETRFPGEDGRNALGTQTGNDVGVSSDRGPTTGACVGYIVPGPWGLVGVCREPDQSIGDVW